MFDNLLIFQDGNIGLLFLYYVLFRVLINSINHVASSGTQGKCFFAKLIILDNNKGKHIQHTIKIII